MIHLINAYKGFEYTWDFDDVDGTLVFYIIIDGSMKKFYDEEEIKKFIDKRLRLKKLNRII
jgi:hypothetical protein